MLIRYSVAAKQTEEKDAHRIYTRTRYLADVTIFL